jgi:drug/metabolite transporter (DMT)-like permease
MIWFVPALAGALAQAGYSAGAKVLLPRITPAWLAGGSCLVAAVSLAVISLARGVPVISPGFFGDVLVTAAINTAATCLLYRALSLSDLSLCMPILSFTPVFLLVTSFAILGEVPTIFGLAGICLVAAGSFMLAANEVPGRASPRAAPSKILLSDRGIQFMLIVAFLYSISVNYDKVVVEKSDSVLGSAVIFGLPAGIFLLGAGILRFFWKVCTPCHL